MTDTSAIKEHMPVIASDGKTIGKVDHMDGTDRIKLTKNDSPDGQHHTIPVSWIARIDEHVHLTKSSTDATAQWG